MKRQDIGPLRFKVGAPVKGVDVEVEAEAGGGEHARDAARLRPDRADHGLHLGRRERSVDGRAGEERPDELAVAPRKAIGVPVAETREGAAEPLPEQARAVGLERR